MLPNCARTIQGRGLNEGALYFIHSLHCSLSMHKDFYCFRLLQEDHSYLENKIVDHQNGAQLMVSLLSVYSSSVVDLLSWPSKCLFQRRGLPVLVLLSLATILKFVRKQVVHYLQLNVQPGPA